MKRRLLRRNFRYILLLQVLFTSFFFGNATLGYFLLRGVAEDQKHVNIANNNITLIQDLLVDLLRTETGQRGYLLSALESYAVPYAEALADIGARIYNLENAPLDAEQRQRRDALRQLVEQRLLELDNNFSLLSEYEQRTAIRDLMSHRGLRLMLDINTLINTMESHERVVLAQRLAEAEQGRRSAFLLILTANLVGLLLVFTSLIIARRSMHKELRSLEEIEDSKQDLELKVAERTRALQHFAIELKRSNRELQDFAFVASHDLQEPLRKIRAFGDRLQGSYADHLGTEGQDYIRRMQSASERMSRLITDLLTFSRITTRTKPFLPVSLNQVAAEVLEDLEVAIEETGARISFGELPVIEADEFQMKQLFQNLISNGIKFRRPGVAPVISVSADPHPEGSPTEASPSLVTLRFTDNGIGFDESYIDRIFLPFQRLHNKSQYSGTGIGLAVCLRVVERHGGTLTATSEPGSGSTFIVTLSRINHVYDVEDAV